MRFNAPRNSEEAALMNARKKEKKKMLAASQKPTSPSGWTTLGEHFYKWVKENEWSKDIDDYANTHGYPAYSFKTAWVKESEIFKMFFEQATHITLSRRYKYMDLKDKYFLIVMKELPLYNWSLADYEKSLKKQEEETVKGNITYLASQFAKTEKGDEFEKKKKGKE